MTVRAIAATSLVAGASFAALAVATPAYAVCESYSGGCASTPPTAPPGGGGGAPIDGGTENPGAGEEPTGTVTEQSGPAGPAGSRTPRSTGTPATLPFTGGELVLLSTVGVGALVGGTALVVAGRRRRETA